VETYRAVIREPRKAPPKPDQYGTYTLEGDKSTYGPSPVTLHAWAALVLPKCTEGAYCDIYKVEEVFVERLRWHEQDGLVNVGVTINATAD
jgi:hypothetical protein